jgi:16S rRNA (guanine527-N7)-methyltransferase
MMASLDDLHDALRESRRLGFLGARPIDEVIEHARSFVRGLDAAGSNGSVIDLGAGGGVPGLVIAHDRVDLRITLLDRRTKRTDFLERMVRRLGWSDRVSVAAMDVDEFTVDRLHTFDAAVARGFGPPNETLACAVRLVRRGGRIVISEPPVGDRWDSELLARLGVVRIPHPETTVAIFVPS